MFRYEYKIAITHVHLAILFTICFYVGTLASIQSLHKKTFVVPQAVIDSALEIDLDSMSEEEKQKLLSELEESELVQDPDIYVLKFVKEDKKKSKLDNFFDFVNALKKRKMRPKKVNADIAKSDSVDSLLNSIKRKGLSAKKRKILQKLRLNEAVKARKRAKEMSKAQAILVKAAKDAIKKHSTSFRKIYEKLLLRDEFLSGKVTLIITIGGNVNVLFKGDGESSTVNQLKTELASATRKISFPSKLRGQTIKLAFYFGS